MVYDILFHASAETLHTIETAAALVRVTEQARPQAPLHRLHHAMRGADLAILAQPEDVHDTYAGSVRAEYHHVDDAGYKAGRQNALNHFHRMAQADTLYTGRYFSNLKTEQGLHRPRAGCDGLSEAPQGCRKGDC